MEELSGMRPLGAAILLGLLVAGCASEQCQPAYLDCEELQGRRPQELSAVDGAVDWLKRNHNVVLAGSIVTLAGVAFIVAFPPGALIALVPLTALSSSDVTCQPQFAAVEP